MKLYYNTSGIGLKEFTEVVSWFDNDPEGFVRWTGQDFEYGNAVSALNQLPANAAVKQITVYSNTKTLIGYFELHHHEDKNYLARFVIRPDMRRNGIGREALKYIISQSKRALGLIVYKSNKAAMALYKSLGFVPEKAIDDHTIQLVLSTCLIAQNRQSACFY